MSPGGPQRWLRRAYAGLSPRAKSRILAMAREIVSSSPVGNPTFGSVDTVVSVSPEGAFLSGWLSGVADGDRVELVSASGARTEVGRSWHRFRRPDVDSGEGRIEQLGRKGEESGYAFFARTPRGPLRHPGMHLDVRLRQGGLVHMRTPAATWDPFAGRREVFASIVGYEGRAELLADHVHPAMEGLTRRLDPLVSVRRVIERGSPPAEPEVSIVIPLYGSLELLTPQLAQLAADPDLRRAELIYVLDSPELERQLENLSAQLFRLYRIPMRLVIHERNGGFGHANNHGAAHARGSLLLLLNSDVFPDRPGWLGRMVDFYRSTPRIGTLGARLLYEDGTLQHAGIYFEREPISGIWQNSHPGKGLPPPHGPASLARPVPAVTGACMLIARDLYEAMGGLDTSYVQGDYEDSDLCLRLRLEGRESWYLPDAQLYHLERQAYRASLQDPVYRAATTYNRWLQTHRWDAEIEELMRDSAPQRPFVQALQQA